MSDIQAGNTDDLIDRLSHEENVRDDRLNIEEYLGVNKDVLI